MTKIFLWFFVFLACLLGSFFIYKGAKKIRKGGPSFKWQELFKETPFKESSGAILIIEGIFGLLCGAALLYLLLNWF